MSLRYHDSSFGNSSGGGVTCSERNGATDGTGSNPAARKTASARRMCVGDVTRTNRCACSSRSRGPTNWGWSRVLFERDHPQFVGPLLRELHAQRFVLVTSPTHMRRALAVFRAAGFDPVPSVAPLRSEHVTPPPLLLPNDESWYLSDMAVYDYLALAYYWWRGWLR